MEATFVHCALSHLALVTIQTMVALFDLGVGDLHCRPDAAMGYAACQNIQKEIFFHLYSPGRHLAESLDFL